MIEKLTGTTDIVALEILIRIIVACCCGACVGFERTKRAKSAGIRTHCIIASTAALLMIMSKHCFSDLSVAGVFNDGVKGADPARIAAQIVSGISFLGAGVIFKNGGSVKGLTTAAGIWATAAIGMAVGSGMYIPGVILTALIVSIQLLLHKFNFGCDAYSEQIITIQYHNNDSIKSSLNKQNDDNSINLLSYEFRQEDNVVIASFKLKSSINMPDYINTLSKTDGVMSVKMSNE